MKPILALLVCAMMLGCAGTRSVVMPDAFFTNPDQFAMWCPLCETLKLQSWVQACPLADGRGERNDIVDVGRTFWDVQGQWVRDPVIFAFRHRMRCSHGHIFYIKNR